MIVCLCHGVSDRAIRAAIRQGNTTLRAVQQATSASTCCGSCACDVKRMLKENAANSASSSASGPFPALLR